MKTLELEEIYREPRQLDPYLSSGEPVQVVSAGKAVAEFLPLTEARQALTPKPFPEIDFQARFLAMWGPDAFTSTVSVTEDLAMLREQRF